MRTFGKLKTQTAGIFNGAAGMAAYQAKDYAKAQQYLSAAVAADPPDATSLRDVYPLALAYLTPPVCAPAARPAAGGDATQTPTPTSQQGCSGPDNEVAGLFYIARAADLAQGAGKDQIAKFGKSKYAKYPRQRRGMDRSDGEGRHGYHAGRDHDHTIRSSHSCTAGCMTS